jgi:hypothetical protein
MMVNLSKLMIGDWVKTNPSCGKLACGIKSNIARVSEIGFFNTDGMFVSFAGIKGRYYDDEVEFIPLTIEILEKNGFEKNRDYGYFIGQSNSGYYIYLDNNYLSIQAGNDAIEFAWCEYVHELQHALKLCGITKSIKL